MPHFTNQPKPRHLIGKTIEIGGDTWEVVNVGIADDEKVYCHLASKTRGRQQRNGWVAVQMADFVQRGLLEGSAA